MKKTKHIHSSIVNKCKKNDAKAQMQIYNLYCKAMFLVAKRYLKDDYLAEDVMQEAFIKAFKNINLYKEEVSFGAWLKKIVINQSIDELKRKKLEFVSYENITENLTSEENWRTEQDTTIELVVEGINQLKEKYRVVLSLFLLEGYDHKEISEILDITEVSSRTHLLRGKKQLLKNLNNVRYAQGY